jgi:microcystin-dependent protein
MPTLSITKTYSDGSTLFEADLDNIRTSLSTFFNTTKIDSDNIQNNGITGAKLTTSCADGSTLEYSGTSLRIKDGGVTAAKLASGVALPSGMISPYGGTSAPTGWLLCDGSNVSRTDYASLFTAIGTAFGSGNGSTTFSLPDLRGRFIRGRDGDTNRDPDRASRTAMSSGGNTGDNVGSVQGDATAVNGLSATAASNGNHNHNVTSDANSTAGATRAWYSGNDTGTTTEVTSTDGEHSHTITLDSSNNETRPLNAYVNFIIKT